MVDTEKLNARIKESGLQKSFISSKIGISLNSLQNKISGKNSFKDHEIYTIKKTLGLSDSEFIGIFFADYVHTVSTRGVENV